MTNRASFDEDRGTPSMDNWNRLLREIRAATQPRLILSSEGFAYAQSDAIRRIVDDLDPHRVHVVVTLRPLQRILASEWQEHVQSGLRAGFENWLDAMLNKPPGRLTPTFWHRQRHDALIARWAEVVGPASLTAVVVDDRDHAFLLRAFERLLGLRDGTLEVQRDVTNRSLTLGELTAIRALSEQFIAEGLSRAAFHRIVRMKVAAFMKARPPDPGELRIETPQWALDRAGEIEREIVAGIRASGVRVVGDLDVLTVVPTSPLAGDRLPEIEVPAAVAGSMAMGALLSGGAVPGAASAETANGDGRPRFNELRVGDVATRRLVAVIATRMRRSIRRGLARLTGRGVTSERDEWRREPRDEAADGAARGEGFRADLEGMRAVAVLLVLAFHAGLPGFDGGYVGVDVFFVLSGFLITGLLVRELAATGRISLPRFYARRARRLLPAAALTLLATLALSAILLPPLRVPVSPPMSSRRLGTSPTSGSGLAPRTTSPRTCPRRPSSTSGRSGWRSSSTCSGRRCSHSSPGRVQDRRRRPRACPCGHGAGRRVHGVAAACRLADRRPAAMGVLPAADPGLGARARRAARAACCRARRSQAPRTAGRLDGPRARGGIRTRAGRGDAVSGHGGPPPDLWHRDGHRKRAWARDGPAPCSPSRRFGTWAASPTASTSGTGRSSSCRPSPWAAPCRRRRRSPSSASLSWWLRRATAGSRSRSGAAHSSGRNPPRVLASAGAFTMLIAVAGGAVAVGAGGRLQGTGPDRRAAVSRGPLAFGSDRRRATAAGSAGPGDRPRRDAAAPRAGPGPGRSGSQPRVGARRRPDHLLERLPPGSAGSPPPPVRVGRRGCGDDRGPVRRFTCRAVVSGARGDRRRTPLAARLADQVRLFLDRRARLERPVQSPIHRVRRMARGRPCPDRPRSTRHSSSSRTHGTTRSTSTDISRGRRTTRTSGPQASRGRSGMAGQPDRSCSSARPPGCARTRRPACPHTSTTPRCSNLRPGRRDGPAGGRCRHRARNGATFIDPTSLLCFTDPCPSVIGRFLVYRDTHHMTATYARALASRLEAAMPSLDSLSRRQVDPDRRRAGRPRSGRRASRARSRRSARRRGRPTAAGRRRARPAVREDRPRRRQDAPRARQPVRAVGDRDRPLGVRADRQARHAEDRRLLLDAAGVGDDERGAAHERRGTRRSRAARRSAARSLDARPAASSVGAAARVERQDDRQLRRRRHASIATSRAPPRAVVDVGRAVQRRDGVRPGEVVAARGPPPASNRSRLREQRVDHRVADEVDPLGGDALAAQVRRRASGLVTNSRSESRSVTRRLTSSGIVSSKLRRPASTCASGMASFARHERGRERRVDVAVDDDERRLELDEQRRSRRDHAAPRSGRHGCPSRRRG